MAGNVWTCSYCAKRMAFWLAQPHLRANHEPELRKAQVALRKRRPLMEQLEMGPKGEK